MGKLRVFKFLALVAVFVMALGVVSAQLEDNVLYVNWGEGDIPTLDPSLGTDTSSIQIVIEIFPGLTRIDEVTYEVGDGMASWTTSEDGLTYTFSLLPEVSWVKYNAETGEVEQLTDADGNVLYVTANDFKYGMLRSMDPALGSYYGGILASWVQGGAAYNADEGSIEDVAITVVDDYTLEIVAPEAAAFLPNIYGMWMATAQPQAIVEEFGDQWTEAENIVSYGPFAVSEWVHEESLTIVKNPFWVGTETIPAPTLDAVVGTMLSTEAALANYEAGLLDVTGVPSADYERVVADPTLSEEYSTGPGSCTYSYVFNTAVAPFDDVRVRQAFSMAINRQEIIDNVLKAGQEPAFFWSRPNLVAAPLQDDFPDFVIGEDDELARELINEYIAENGELPTITASHNESSGHGEIMAAAVEMWRTTLGVEDIQITTQEWATYLETIKNDDTAPGIFRYAWCLDYPDTHNFLFDVFHSSVIELGASWQSDEFDSLVEEAKTETDTAVRTDLYLEAEYILTVEDAVLIPVYYYTSSRLTKPYVERPYGGLGNTYYENWSVSR